MVQNLTYTSLVLGRQESSSRKVIHRVFSLFFADLFRGYDVSGDVLGERVRWGRRVAQMDDRHHYHVPIRVHRHLKLRALLGVVQNLLVLKRIHHSFVAKILIRAHQYKWGGYF